MAHLYAYYDQSGHGSQHPVIALAGFVDEVQRWQEFYRRWNELLREYEIKSFRTVEALRYSRPYGKMERADAKQRTKDVLPFVRVIRDTLELGITVAVDVAAYKSAPSILHQAFTGDPEYFAFYDSIAKILRYFAIPRRYEIALIYDENEEQSTKFHKMLRKMKLEIPEVKERVTSMCFCDDVKQPQLQAADMLAYFSRKEADRRFFGLDYEFQELHAEFQSRHPETGKHLHFAGGFYEKQALAAFAEDVLRESGGNGGAQPGL